MSSVRGRNRLGIVLIALAWLLVPEVLTGITGRLFGGGEWAIWLAVAVVGALAICARRWHLRRAM